MLLSILSFELDFESLLQHVFAISSVRQVFAEQQTEVGVQLNRWANADRSCRSGRASGTRRLPFRNRRWVDTAILDASDLIGL